MPRYKALYANGQCCLKFSAHPNSNQQWTVNNSDNEQQPTMTSVQQRAAKKAKKGTGKTAPFFYGA